MKTLKTALRIVVLIATNLLTLPFQILLLIGIYASNLEKEQMDEFYKWCAETCGELTTWIKTGR